MRETSGPRPKSRLTSEDPLKTAQRQATYDAFPPLAIGLAILWTLFIPFNLVDLPGASRAPVILHDVFMVAASLALFLSTRRDRMPVRWTGPIGMLVTCAIASNVLLTYGLTGRNFLSFYIGIILIGAGNLILLTRWFMAAGISTLLAWVLVASRHASPNELANLIFLQVAAVLVAVTIHLTRIRYLRRISELRQRDKEREEALQDLLSQTELARRELDQRVAERTRELQTAHDDLTSQLEQGARLETDRRVLEAELHHAQRLESVGQLAGGVAHDFNNLLTVIGGNMDMVLDTPAAVNETHKAWLEEARDATDRATALTRELLAYSRKQPLVFEAMDPVAIIEGVRAMIERAATEDIELEMVLSQIDRRVLSSRGQIEQVIMNLVLNACDAMPEGGKLRIELDEVERHPGTPRGAESAGPFVRLRVMDTGSGMDEEIRKNVFEPFFTTKETGKGTGLGLSVVHGIVSQHHGLLELESVPSEGTTFSVYLPAVTQQEPGETVELAPHPRDTVPTETVLVAEDEPSVRRFSVMLLENLGYKVLTAGDGAQALEVARKYQDEIHVLLTDVVMPGMPGPALAEQLKLSRPSILVLFVSGYTDPKILGSLNLGEGMAFLQKPFTRNTLRTKIRALMASESIGKSGIVT